MNNGIVKYEALYEITTFSGKKYYIKEASIDLLDKALEEKKFVRFGLSRVNVSSIDTIDPAKPEDNFFQAELQKLNYDDQLTVKKEVKLWKSNTKKDLSPYVLGQIIDKYITR